MSGKEVESNTYYFENLDIGELEDIATDAYSSRQSSDQTLGDAFAELFEKHYSYDIKKGTVHPAIVLEVVSGPQVKDEARAIGKVNTKTLNLESYPYPYFRDKKISNEPYPVVVIAKVAGIDVDTSWPEGPDDVARIEIHNEFLQFREDEALGRVGPGSIIWVTYNNDNVLVSYNGRPVGKIVGVHKTKAFADIKTKISARKASKPKCQAARNLAGPAGGFYVGNTDANPNPDIGPPIRKIKGEIKTGIYGDGSPQTKAHFNACLENADISSRHQIPGPAPNSNNAFIWVGTLKNNGYMDLLDRPIGQGRETIIYAPMTLDLTAPVEIKYYFHDAGGFGAAHVNGPSTTVAQAAENASLPGNDFREKIAPGIKDLNRKGRNYILVIPEMAHSRGYGTSTKDLNRIESLSLGEDAGTGLPPSSNTTTLRTRIPAEARPPVKNYLDKMRIESNKNLLQITPLREREFSTFDGSFTGGNFGDFHQEVVDVLDEHLGTINDKVEFVSILADSLGGICLSGIVKNVPNSETHANGVTSFKNALANKPIRIDYITDDKLDEPGFYSSYLGPGSPSSVIYEQFLSQRDPLSDGYTEFNYITPPSSKQQNAFFNNLGKAEDYKKNSKKASGLGSRKFSFTIAPEITDQRFVSFHVANIRVGYAFSMINDFLDSFPDYPKKPDANTSLKSSYNAVPDHAFALATKPSLGDLGKLTKKRDELLPTIEAFRDRIDAVVSPPEIFNVALGEPEPDYDFACTKYGVYCENGTLKTGVESKFFSEYKIYLENERKFEEIKILINGEQNIQKLKRSKEALIKQKNTYDNLFKKAKEEASSAREGWDSLSSKFDRANFSYESVEKAAKLISAPEAYKKILAKIENQIKNLTPEAVKRPEDCVDPPITIAEATGVVPTTVKSREPENNCSSIKVVTPNNFEELAEMIPYYPKKSDFSFSEGSPSKSKSKVHLVEGYKTSTFKYQARGVNNSLTSKESPRVWACISENLKQGCEAASQESGYYPFEITTGARGLADPKTAGATAYTTGISLHSYGLAVDIDPFITGYRNNGYPLNSIFTNAWTPGFIEIHAMELWRLGVYYQSPSILKNNAYEAENRPRMAENWRGAPSRYFGGGESGGARDKYVNIMNASKGSPIIPAGANPTLWAILFCEKTGMRWGNGLFLKKRHNGGKIWSQAEKDRIATIFNIPRIVDRVQAISWKSSIEDHMHFHYWGGASLVKWKDIEAAPKKEG